MIIGVHCDKKHAKLFSQCVKDLNFIGDLNFDHFPNYRLRYAIKTT